MHKLLSLPASPLVHLIEVLTERFGGVSGELSEQIKRIDSHERLKDMLRQALRVKNFDEFGKKL